MKILFVLSLTALGSLVSSCNKNSGSSSAKSDNAVWVEASIQGTVTKATLLHERGKRAYEGFLLTSDSGKKYTLRSTDFSPSDSQWADHLVGKNAFCKGHVSSEIMRATRCEEVAVQPEEATKFIGFGDLGAMGYMNNILTIYHDANESGARCIGCTYYSLILDDRDRSDISGPFITQINGSSSDSCVRVSDSVTDWQSIFRHPLSPRKGVFEVYIQSVRNELDCAPETRISFSLMAPKCLNSIVPDCAELETRATFSTTLGDIGKLEPYTGEGYPNEVPPIVEPTPEILPIVEPTPEILAEPESSKE